MILLIVTLTIMAVSAAVLKVSASRFEDSERWVAACIIAGVSLASGALFLLVALIKLASSTSLLWLSFALAASYGIALRLEVMKRREEPRRKPRVEPFFPIAATIFLGVFLFSFIK